MFYNPVPVLNLISYGFEIKYIHTKDTFYFFDRRKQIFYNKIYL